MCAPAREAHGLDPAGAALPVVLPAPRPDWVRLFTTGWRESQRRVREESERETDRDRQAGRQAGRAGQRGTEGERERERERESERDRERERPGSSCSPVSGSRSQNPKSGSNSPVSGFLQSLAQPCGRAATFQECMEN